MEKVQLSKYLAAMNSGIPSKLVGVNNGVSVLATPGEISELAGCGTIPKTNLNGGKWYRIAIGEVGSISSSVLFNISKIYARSVPTSQLFYICADGYSDVQNVLNIFSSNKSISKIRILSKRDTTTKCLLDIYTNVLNVEPYLFSYACNIGFKFQAPVEVSNTPDEGYSVKEFVF